MKKVTYVVAKKIAKDPDKHNLVLNKSKSSSRSVAMMGTMAETETLHTEIP